MGKRSNFERRPQDDYPTPASAVEPLLPHLVLNTRFIEPCCGDGHLIRHLKHVGHVLVGAYDLPDDAKVKRYSEAKPETLFITNPPWRRDVLHGIIENLSNQGPTWLLFDADWVHTKQAIPHLPRLRTIISVGRVRWIPDSPYTGKDNCAWHLFSRPRLNQIQFIGRMALPTKEKGSVVMPDTEPFPKGAAPATRAADLSFR